MAATASADVPVAGATAGDTFDPSAPARVMLAVLSAGAGAIHLVMAPIHATASGLEAVGFAAAGWFQILVAGAVIMRPSRWWLRVAIVANLAFIGLWAYSRTVGLPIGTHPGEAEAVGAADLTTVILQGLLVAGCALVLVSPRILAGMSAGALVIASVFPAAAVVAVSAVVVSPQTAQHSHGAGESAGADPVTAQLAALERERCDKGINPVSYWRETEQAGIDTVSTPIPASAPAPSADGHTHGAAATTPTTARPDPLNGKGTERLDEVLSKITSSSEVDAAIVVTKLADLDDREYDAFLWRVGQVNAGHSAHAATGDDTGGHGGHIGPGPWVAMTDAATCHQLEAELTTARETAMKYPTAADAKKAGYFRVTTYVPGIAAHYMKFSIVDGRFDVTQPEMLLYDGNGDEASIVGLSYYVVREGDQEPTQGFTGPNDHFHRHIGLCVNATGVIGDSTTTEEQCTAMGGRKQGGNAGWMNHVWVVPGCESPWGMFSGANPLLDGKLPTQSGKDGGHCNGSGVKHRYDLSPGTNTRPLSTTSTTAPAETQAAVTAGR